MKSEFFSSSHVVLVVTLALVASVLSSPSTVHAQANVSPFYISGQVIADDGQTFPMSVSVMLRCGMRVVQAIHPDVAGNFEFALGVGSGANIEMSAANDSYGSQEVPHMDSRGTEKDSEPNLFNCQLEVSAPGYRPTSKPVMFHTGEVGTVDVGSLVLAPIAAVEAGTISVASLQAPKNARKEFEKGEQDAHSSRLASAVQHLEKAVAEYDKYSVAWTELGRIYSSNRQTDKAYEAFRKAITADSQFAPPYVGLAALQLNDAQYQRALDTAGEALEFDPGIVVASFIQATANYRLNRLDAAEKSALDAERRPHQSIPQLHLLLAEIYLRKQDNSNATAEMQAYLKESPQGEFARETKKKLEEIQRTQPSPGNGSSFSPVSAP